MSCCRFDTILSAVQRNSDSLFAGVLDRNERSLQLSSKCSLGWALLCFSTFFWSDVGVTYILYACICQAFMLLFPLMLDFLTCDGSTRLQLYCLHKKQVSGEMNVVALIPALVY